MKLSQPHAVLVVAFLGLLCLGECIEADRPLEASEILTVTVVRHQEPWLLRQKISAVVDMMNVTNQSLFRRWWKAVTGLSVIAGVFFLWRRCRPSNDRDWAAEYARTPWAEITGDQVTIHNFRNCEYRTASDFTVHWETKTFTLSKLCGLDLFVNYWGSRHIAHTLLSFDFGDEGKVCTSIETRRERHEPYSAFRGFFRQYELYYVIGHERDLVGLRTNFRKQDVYLYRLAGASPERSRALFLTYLRSANDLRDRPRWYHATMSNCTTNIRLNAQASGVAFTWNWRLLVTGHLDERLYRRGIILSPFGFVETKARAQIKSRASEVDSPLDFSE